MEQPVTSAPKLDQDPTIMRPKANRLASQPAAILLAVLSTVQYLVEAFLQVLFPLLKWSHTKRATAALGHLCRFTSLWALFCLPTAAAAYEFENVDVIAGYGTIPIGTICLMAAVFFRKAHDSVRRHPEKTSYNVWVIAVMLAVPMTLAPAISDVNLLTGVGPITGL